MQRLREVELGDPQPAGREVRARAAARVPPRGERERLAGARRGAARRPRRSSTTQRSRRGAGRAWRGAGRRACRRACARAAPPGIVADALTTSRSPARRWSGRSRKRAWTSGRPRWATISRTSSRTARRRAGLESRGEREVQRAHARAHQLARLVAAAREVALDQREQAGDAVLGRRAVGDVLARERLLVHARVHVAGVDGVDAQVVAARRRGSRSAARARPWTEP